MKINWLALTTVTLALTGTVAMAAKEPCTENVDDCVRHMREYFESRGWVGINMEPDEETGLVTLTKIIPGSPAEQAGLQQGDALLSLNGIPYDKENKKNLKEEYKTFKPGDSITYLVKRQGEKIEVTIQLGTIPDTIKAQWIGQHVLESHLQEPEETASKP
jgi:predicted metalloprotease with PDZ domain